MGPRYDFGRNWSALAARFEEDHVERASRDLQRLVGELAGHSFLDLGCGSGLHAAAALRLGARMVRAVDYDPGCVAVAQATLRRFVPDGDWRVERADALSPGSLPAEGFDVVYSWGVLHHTGDVWAAIRNSAALVLPGGSLALALYLRTPFCGFWRWEKRAYSGHAWLRPLVRGPFAAGLLLARAIRHRDAISHVRNYRQARGMEFLIDVDDWLGGYPYESVAPQELEAFMARLGFRVVRRFNAVPPLGLLGTGCGEWLFEKGAGSREAGACALPAGTNPGI